MESRQLSPLHRWMLFTLLGVLVYMGLFAKRGWIDYRRISHQRNQLQAKIDATRDQLQLLDGQLQAIQTDPLEQERVVRDVLGYVRPNETVVEFD